MRPDVADGPAVDEVAAACAVSPLLVAPGHDVTAESLQDTRRRVAATYAELLQPRSFNLTTFPNDEQYDEMVIARGIPFSSLCEHHLLPFAGVAHVAYLPGDRILGLSELARVVECSPVGSRSRNGSPSRSRPGCSRTCSPRAWASCSRPSTPA